MINITEKEKITLLAYIEDDIVNDYGWESPQASAWVGGYWEDLIEKRGVQKKSIPGIVGSLQKKGVVYTNGDSLKLTELGRNTVSELLNRR